MAVTFGEARQIVLNDWPDYEVAEYGYEGDEHWFVLLLPETAGGRIAGVGKESGEITWINENADIYTEERPVGDLAVLDARLVEEPPDQVRYLDSDS